MKKLIILTALCITSLTANAQTCKTDSIQATTPTDRFKELGNGSEIKDTVTGLIWQRCSVGQTWDGSTCTGTATTHNWQQALQVAQQQGSGYRLPNIKELQSIVEQQCDDPTVNLTIFPNTLSSSYWSASPNADFDYNAWDVNFKGGYSFSHLKYYSYHVRAVRESR